jgi:PII-like signaling protein
VVTVERVRVVRREGRVPTELPAQPAHDEHGLRMWQRVMVFCGEDARWEGHPLHTQLIRRLRQADAAGATALRGTVGYSDDGPLHGDHLLALRRRTPVVVTMIDTVDEIARLWPIVARATAESGLVTAEMVPAFHAIGPGLRVGGLRMARPPVSGSGGSPGRPTR